MTQQKRKTLRTGADLVAAGVAKPAQAAAIDRVAARYAVAVTPAVVDLIDPADPADPIARQFVPDLAELAMTRDELLDPIGDEAHAKVPGIVHRYADRVLLKPHHACPVYCRFCFRREVVGQGDGLTPAQLGEALDYIRSDARIWEVILTGGDPLILSPRRIAEVTVRLGQIVHVKVLRWHTRVPVVAPERVTAELVAALKSTTQAVYIGLHANHPRELTPAARAACARLVDAGLVMVSQTVLLRGVNDDVETLDQLMRALVEARVKPYYLHHLDRAPGTSHFRTSIVHGQRLMRQLRGRLSGLAQPTYVLDIPGGHGKMPIGPDYLDVTEAGISITDFQGVTHSYCECVPEQAETTDGKR